MIYTKAILYEPEETKGYYHKELRLDLYVNDKVEKSIQEKSWCFDISAENIIVKEVQWHGHDNGGATGSIKLIIPMRNVEQFEKL